MTDTRHLPTALTAEIPGLYRLSAPLPASPLPGPRLQHIDIDCSAVANRDELLSTLSARLEAPAPLPNWDALLDALRDLSWIAPGRRSVLTIRALASLASNEPASYHSVVAILLDAAAFWSHHPETAPILVLELPQGASPDP